MRKKLKQVKERTSLPFVYATDVHEKLLSTVRLSEKASRALFKEAPTSLGDIFFSEMCIAWERNVTHCM